MNYADITMEQFHEAIINTCEKMAAFLVEKNTMYGNAILHSPNIFSNTTPLQKIADRLDDKVSRVISGKENDPEDAKLDIIGYLLLEQAILSLGVEDEGRSVGSPKVVEQPKEKAVEKKKTTSKKKKTTAKKSPAKAKETTEPLVISDEPTAASDEPLVISDEPTAVEDTSLVLDSSDVVQKTEASDLETVDADDILASLGTLVGDGEDIL